MSVLISTKDNIERHAAVLAGSTATTLFEGRDDQVSLAISVNICNKNASTSSYTIDTYDGTTQVIWKIGSLATDTSENIDLGGVPIVEGHSLRITGVASMHVTTIIAPAGRQ